MIKLLFTAAALLTVNIVSLYSIRTSDVDNNLINFNDYRGKKILIVNTASGSNKVSQLTALQQLYSQHHDSLVVIAFPSNSFGNEPKTNAEIKAFMRGSYGITFPIAAKSDVTGSRMNALYQWLGSKLQNEVTNGQTHSDFQKYLVDKKGVIVGVYDSSINPLGTVMEEAIGRY